MIKTFAIANQKGGVGKTTTAVNLAACLALSGRRCLLIDLDPQGNASSGLGAEKRSQNGADGALTDPERPDTWIEKTRIDNLSLAPATDALASAEALLRHEVRRNRQLKRAIDVLDDKFDFVFVDCPPSSGLLALNGLVAADEVIVPVQCEYYAMEGLAQVLETLNVAQAEENAHVEIGGFLFTMYEPGVRLADEVVSEVLKHFTSKTYNVRIPRDVALSEAPSHGQSVVEYAPRSRGANAYIQLAREIANAC